MKQTVGEQLRSARESKGISLAEVVKATHIRLNYLQELENDHPELLNSESQARGFLRLYASFLGISSTSLIEQWQEAESTGSELEEEHKKPDQGSTSDDDIASKSHPSLEEEHQQGVKNDEEKKNAPFSLRDLLDRVPKLSSLMVSKKKEAQSILETAEESPPENIDLEELSEPAKIPIQRSEDIYKDIGFALRARRLALELTLSDV